MEDTKEKLVAAFDESILKIGRLHFGWLECTRYREHGNFHAWRWKLDTLYLELSFELERLDIENENKIYQDMIKKLDADAELYFVRGDRVKIYATLKEKEKLLRKVQQESGMGAKHRSVYEDEMD